MNEISIKKAAMINFTAKYANIIIQIIYNAILSRILTPQDFGIVAVTTVFITFFMLFADMGFGTAVIQNKTLTRDEIDSIFSFTFYMAILLWILFALFSVPMSMFYGNDVYKPIGIILSFALFFNAMNMIPNAVLLKNKRFKTVGLRLVTVSVLTCILTIIMALVGFRYYAIALYSVISSFFTFIWNYRSTGLKLKLKPDMAAVKKIRDFSMFQFAFSFVNYFSRNLDNLLTGKFIGSTALAYYDKGYRLMLYPVSNLTFVITPVLHPILSDHQKDKEYIYTNYLKVVKILSLLGVFISLYCFFSAKEIVLLVFGNQWVNSVESFKFLALSVWAQMVASSTGAIFQSLGNTRLMFICGLYTAAVIVSAIILGVSFKNITIVAACVTAAYCINFFITYFMLIKKGFGYSYICFLKKFIPDLIIFIIMFAALYISSFYKIENNFLSALYKMIVGLTAYISGLLVTKQYKSFYILLRHRRR